MRRRRITINLSMALALLSLPSLAAQADEGAGSCPALFSIQSSSQQAGRWQSLDLTSLNEPSQEYVRRLIYLAQERRLVPPESLEKVIASEQPLNPLGDRTANLTLVPHHAAFAALLQDELQWEKIRSLTRNLVGAASQEQTRREDAKQETAGIIGPILLKTFPFATGKVIRTPKGQLLAINMTHGYRNSQDEATISAYEIPSGAQVSQQTFRGIDIGTKLDAGLVDDKVIAAATSPGHDHMVDVLNDKVITEQVLEPEQPVSFLSFWMGRTPSVSKAHLIDYQGKPAIIGFHDGQIILSDPKTNRVLVSPYPNGDQTTPAIPGFQYLRPFTYQQRAYVLALETTSSNSPKKQKLRVIDLKTGRKSRSSFEVANRAGLSPNLIDTFEKDGTLYGIIDTSEDVYRVDLIKGQIVGRASEALTDSIIAFCNTDMCKTRVGFDVRGQHYLVGVLHSNERTSAPRLSAIDPMTFEPIGVPLQLPDDTIGEFVYIVPGTEDHPQALVVFPGGPTLLVSLLNEI